MRRHRFRRSLGMQRKTRLASAAKSEASSRACEAHSEHYATLCATFETDASKKAFQFAVQFAGAPKKIMGAVQKNARVADPEFKRALHLGYVMGAARRVQQVRKPDSSLLKFNPVVAFELGEDMG